MLAQVYTAGVPRAKTRNERRSLAAPSQRKSAPFRSPAQSFSPMHKAAQKTKAKATPGFGDLRRRVWTEPRVLLVLPQPGGVQGDVQEQERRHGARPKLRFLPVPEAVGRRPGRTAPPEQIKPDREHAVPEAFLAACALVLVLEELTLIAPRVWRDAFRSRTTYRRAASLYRLISLERGHTVMVSVETGIAKYSGGTFCAGAEASSKCGDADQSLRGTITAVQPPLIDTSTLSPEPTRSRAEDIR